MKMLHDIVEAAIRRKVGGGHSRRWLAYNLSIEDARQEAWVAVLEAEKQGMVDPAELQRAAEMRLNFLIQQASRQARREIPVGQFVEESGEDEEPSEELEDD